MKMSFILISGAVTVCSDDNTSNPARVEARTIVLFDHDDDLNANVGNYGDDVIAGGADDDVIFGQLGDDQIHGDGLLER